MHRLIEINGTFVPRTGRRGRVKLIKRDSMSFILRVREMTLSRGQPIHSLIAPIFVTSSTLARVSYLMFRQLYKFMIVW